MTSNEKYKEENKVNKSHSKSNPCIRSLSRTTTQSSKNKERTNERSVKQTRKRRIVKSREKELCRTHREEKQQGNSQKKPYNTA